jgi:predicted secreted hydrolase
MARDFALLIAAALVLVAWLAWQVQRDDAPSDAMRAGELLASAPEEFRRVTAPRAFEFPADHAAHPGFRNEWWYFTGNLETPEGKPLGFQFTLFRFELEPGPRPQSAWASDTVWMAHLALSDIQSRTFHQAQRFARGALGLAGADTHRWWLRDWTVERVGDRFELSATTPEFALDLKLVPQRPIVLQGNAGYSRKGPEPGNASHYYSITRLGVEGAVRIDQQEWPVSGLAWLDREWGSSQLGADLAGWDWFSLQLDDGRDLMVYRLRTQDGEASPFSAGKLVDPDGNSRTLGPADFTATPRRQWRDPQGQRWPVAWTVEVPSEDLKLEVETRFDEQRWTGAVDYWEGAVSVRDAGTGESVGRGYLELSGYAE